MSETSGAYSDARTRLKLETVEFFANRVCDSLIKASPPSIDGRYWFTLDGTTMTLAPTPELKAAFPPASNQHGESVWPVMLVLVAHELVSSCALPPEIGAMYGEKNTSEGKLAKQMAKRLPRGSVAMADSGYGIFSVAHAMVSEGHSILFLLTQPPCSAADWTTRYEAALQIASRDKLPNRPGRSDPRRAHPRRPKSTKFMKQQSKQHEKPPPEKPK